MEIVGLVALILVALVVVLVLFMTIRSIPDIRRYLKIRHM